MTWSPKKMRAWYDSLVDFILANPDMKLNEVAAHFNRTPQTIYMVTGSDAFKAKLAARRAEFREALDEQIVEKNMKVANVALEAIAERIEDDRDKRKIPIATIGDLADKALNRLGYSPKALPGSQPGAPGSLTVVVPVSATIIEAARQNLRQLEQQKVIEYRTSKGVEERTADSRDGSAASPETSVTLEAVELGE